MAMRRLKKSGDVNRNQSSVRRQPALHLFRWLYSSQKPMLFKTNSHHFLPLLKTKVHTVTAVQPENMGVTSEYSMEVGSHFKKVEVPLIKAF